MLGDKRCDIGGTYWYPEIPGPAVLKPPCEAPVTHRYRKDGATEEWGHRCSEHAGWLNAPGLIVEPLARNRPRRDHNTPGDNTP